MLRLRLRWYGIHTREMAVVTDGRVQVIFIASSIMNCYGTVFLRRPTRTVLTA